MLSYTLYAERWQWTPQQVDNLSLEQDDWLLPIADAMDKERHHREELARRKAERKNKNKGISS